MHFILEKQIVTKNSQHLSKLIVIWNVVHKVWVMKELQTFYVQRKLKSTTTNKCVIFKNALGVEVLSTT